MTQEWQDENDELLELTIEDAFDILFRFQIRFDGNVCKEIFGDEYCDFFWDKWESSHKNALLFWNRLDTGRKMRVIDFVRKRFL